MNHSKMKLNGVLLSGALILVSFGCVTNDDATPDASGIHDGGVVYDGGAVYDGGGAGNTIACDDVTDFMDVVVSSAPKAAYVRITPNSYGANLFYIYEVIEDPANVGEYLYASNNNPVENRIAAVDWTVPEGKLWSAGRLELDGLDPFAPTTDNWFIYPYLPFAKWRSSNDAYNDGQTCPGLTGTDTYGRPRCIGKHQLDSAAPNLVDDKLYLIRMVMNVLVPGSRPNACYQRVFTYAGGTYTRD